MGFAQAKNLKRIKITDSKLLFYLVNAVIIETIICTIYTVLHQLNGGVEKVYLAEFNRIEYKCNLSPGVQYVNGANYLYIFTLILILCFFSFKNRATYKVFKESRCAYFGSFFSLFTFLVVFIFNMVVDDVGIIITIQSGAMLIALSVIWILFYGVRMYKFYNSSASSGSTNATTQQQTEMRTRASSDMPTYVNRLYDEQGFKGSRTSANVEHSIPTPSVMTGISAGLPAIPGSPHDSNTTTSVISPSLNNYNKFSASGQSVSSKTEFDTD